MKKMIITIIILAIIFIGMVINRQIEQANEIKIEEIQLVENYMEKIYGWSEITNQALPEFDNVNEANIFHEYEFIYTLNNTKYHGVIDLMLEYPSHIDIIDYKLSDVTDINYISQLNGYKEYISSITKKPVNVYLYSIINEKISSL